MQYCNNSLNWCTFPSPSNILHSFRVAYRWLLKNSQQMLIECDSSKPRSCVSRFWCSIMLPIIIIIVIIIIVVVVVVVVGPSRIFHRVWSWKDSWRKENSLKIGLNDLILLIHIYMWETQPSAHPTNFNSISQKRKCQRNVSSCPVDQLTSHLYFPFRVSLDIFYYFPSIPSFSIFQWTVVGVNAPIQSILQPLVISNLRR